MSKKIMLLVICSVVFIVLVASYFMNYRNVPEGSENNQPQNNPSEDTEEPQLVIPESPIGTLGLISALAAGFGMFTIMKKKR